MKCMQLVLEIKLIHRLHPQFPHPHREILHSIRCPVAFTTRTKMSRTSSSASRRYGNLVRVVSAKSLKFDVEMMESFTQLKRPNKSFEARRIDENACRKWDDMSSFPTTSIVWRFLRHGSRMIYSLCKLNCAAAASRTTSRKSNMFRNRSFGLFCSICSW